MPNFPSPCVKCDRPALWAVPTWSGWMENGVIVEQGPGWLYLCDEHYRPEQWLGQYGQIHRAPAGQVEA